MISAIEVQIGQVHTLSGSGLLRTSALGSCIAITFHHRALHLGAMAHVMLPDYPPPATSSDRRNRYAGTAIEAMLQAVTTLGADPSQLHATLIGAGNVLRKPTDNICQQNIDSVTELLAYYNVPVVAQKLGGFVRRSAQLDVASGYVYYTEDNGPATLLWPKHRTAAPNRTVGENLVFDNPDNSTPLSY